MSRPLNSATLPSAPPPTWTVWAWLALATVATVVYVFGFLHAGRPFWRLACEHSSSPSSLRA